MTSYKTTVPANTSATLYLPMGGDNDSFQAIKGVTYTGTAIRNGIEVGVYELSSGTFNFTLADNTVKVE